MTRKLGTSPCSILYRCGPERGSRINKEAERRNLSQLAMMNLIVDQYFNPPKQKDKPKVDRSAFDKLLEGHDNGETALHSRTTEEPEDFAGEPGSEEDPAGMGEA